MKICKYPYILLLGVLAAGCADDPLLRDPDVFDSEYVGYTAVVAPATEVSASRSQGERTLYEPLVLNDENGGEHPLYLHTWVHAMADTDVQSRGVQVNSEQELWEVHGNIGVRAFDHDEGSEYFAMQKARPTSTAPEAGYRYWTTDQTHRWPGTHRLDFSAIAPYTHISEVKNLALDQNRISFSYTAQKSGNQRDAEAQTDLMMAASSFTRRETEEYNYRARLPFGHALSAVKFAVRDVLEGEVVSITIRGIMGSGDCVFTSDLHGENGQFTWSNLDNLTEYTQLFNHPISDGNFDPDDESQDVLLNEDTPEKTFMLIPQAIPDNAEIEVVIRRNHVVAGKPETITVRGKIKDNLVTEWLPGHEYVYTISTSKDNWVYVFNVLGNEAKGYKNIYVYSPADTLFAKPKNTGYYSVRSYRYRANDQNHVENMPWTATFDGSESYTLSGSAYPNKYISSEKWITDRHENKFHGDGGTSFEQHDVDFYPHYLCTTWQGDITMQANKEFANTSKEKPYDLSTCGGHIDRTTANCYIVDRGGWYCLPLIYGNAMKRGQDWKNAYIPQGNKGTYNLSNYLDYNNKAITSPYIIKSITDQTATLVWEDAYNVVDQKSVELYMDGSQPMLRFYVDKGNLQQGNAIVALRDKDNVIMWSWHLWFTEHWLVADNEGAPTYAVPHIFGSDASFAFVPNPTTLMRERGDSKITKNLEGTYYMASYNLGWCDAKNVEYLSRKNEMVFVQGTSGKVKKLDLVQAGEVVEYKIGNNTYYQFGRKDPMVGFQNRAKRYKSSFGPIPYAVEDQKDKHLADGIRNPHILYVGLGNGDNEKVYQDWTIDQYSNLWNNHMGSGFGTTEYMDDIWSHVKTVYDPCPAGYMVPNTGVWHIVGEGLSWSGHPGSTDNADGVGYYKEFRFDQYFNGMKYDKRNSDDVKNIYTYKIWGDEGTINADGSVTHNDENAVYMVPTGNRWYSNHHTFTQSVGDIGQERVDAGLNLNLRIAYAWSNHWNTPINKYGVISYTYAACGVAFGIDKPKANDNGDEEFFLAAEFLGRRAMGRPVRPIREPDFWE